MIPCSFCIIAMATELACGFIIGYWYARAKLTPQTPNLKTTKET